MTPVNEMVFARTDNGSFPSLEMGTLGKFFLAVFLMTSLTVAFILLATDGNMFAPFAFVAATGMVLVTIYRVDWGFMFLVGFVLVFDQFRIPGAEPITLKVAYFRNIKEIPYVPSFAAAVINPLELHLLLLLFVWFVVAAVKKELKPVPVLVSTPAILFFVGMLGFLAYGLQQGGEVLPALWEVRALFYFGIVYFFTPQVIRTKEQIHALLWICIAAISIKAFQGLARFVAFGFSTAGFPTLTNHEDPVFMLSLIVFLFALVVVNSDTNQRWALLFLLLPLLLGFYVAQRRAAYAAIAPAFACLIAALPRRERWVFIKTVFPILAAVALYVFIFWESESRLAAPVRLVKTGLSLDPETAGERYYSNLYREIEKYDLARTVQRAPVVGIGFGNKYDQPIPLVDIPFPLRDVIPHNQVLWLLVKTGAVGFFLFWFFLNGFAVSAVQTILQTRDPYLKAVCMLALVAVVNQVVVSYFDLQLTYYRNMVYLGMLMGLVSSVAMINKSQHNASANSNR